MGVWDGYFEIIFFYKISVGPEMDCQQKACSTCSHVDTD